MRQMLSPAWIGSVTRNPRLVLIDSRAPSQEIARRKLESEGWRRVHWAAMNFWFARSSDLRRFRVERLIVSARVFLWKLKRSLRRSH